MDYAGMRLRRGNLCHESIAVPRHSLNVLLRIESFSQLGNTIVEIVVFDDGVRPYRIHERIFAHELAGILDSTRRVSNSLPRRRISSLSRSSLRSSTSRR